MNHAVSCEQGIGVVKKTTKKKLAFTLCGLVVMYAVFFWIVRDAGARLTGLVSGGIGALSAYWFSSREQERLEIERQTKERQKVEG